MIDIEAAARAQKAMTYWSPSDPSQHPPQAEATTLVLIAGLDAAEALAALGLIRPGSA